MNEGNLKEWILKNLDLRLLIETILIMVLVIWAYQIGRYDTLKTLEFCKELAYKNIPYEINESGIYITSPTYPQIEANQNLNLSLEYLLNKSITK